MHACCHNPTGADLSDAQWAEVVAVCRERGLIPFLDMAYQASPTASTPTPSRCACSASGLQFFVSSSFLRSRFSLYGERVGALSIVTASKDEAGRVLSQVKRVIRTNYSNPPIRRRHRRRGAGSPELRQMWKTNSAACASASAPCAPAWSTTAGRGRGRDFSFVIKQRGMFSYTGPHRRPGREAEGRVRHLRRVAPAASAWPRSTQQEHRLRRQGIAQVVKG